MAKSDLRSVRIEAAEDIFLERHSCCIGCPYNTASKLSKDGVSAFNCTADIKSYPCSYIPELYPHKMANAEEGLDESQLGLFEVTLVDTVTETMNMILAVGNSAESVKDIMDKKLESPAWSHVVVKRVRPMKEINGYTVLLAPNDVTKVYYPEFELDIENRQKVKLDSIHLEVVRMPSTKEEHDETNHKLRVLGGGRNAERKEVDIGTTGEP